MLFCFCRLWETMTMGTVAVLEKSMGLDKAVSIMLLVM